MCCVFNVSEELRKINKVYRQEIVDPKSYQYHTTNANADMLVHVNNVLSRGTRLNGCRVPQRIVSQYSHPFTIQHDLPPKKCNENFPQNPSE